MKGKTRRSVVVLAVVAMIAGLLALPVAPAAAATAACPSSIPSAGFTDLTGYSAATVDAVNCIAFYGVTSGTGPGTYGPAGEVTRWQMALFLMKVADAAGITLPSGADQGFTDIAGLGASTEVAINQLKQLGITSGTSATTYSPYGTVTRWQMALFLVKLVDVAGMALPSGADQGFTDIAGLGVTTELAINQAKQLGITSGTTATTYAPFDVVTRWQMALFLAADMDAAGVQTTGALSAVAVAPSTSAELAFAGARAYTATFTNSNGSPYSGYVGIQLLDASSTGAPIYNTDATNVAFETVNGATFGGQEWNGFAGISGTVTFVVRNAVAGSDVVPVAWQDLDGDAGYETTSTTALPLEPYALGGWTTFGASIPAEAGNGTFAGVTVMTVASGRFDSATASYFYDSNDVFQVEGVPGSMADFEAALSKTDVMAGNYFDTASGISQFNITTDNTATTAPTVATPATAVSIDSDNYTVTGKGEPGYVINLWNDADNGTDIDAGEAKLATGTIATDGTWSLTVPLQQNADNNFIVEERATATSAAGTPVDVPTISEGAPAAAHLVASAGTNGGGALGTLEVGDAFVLNFNETVKAPTNGDLIEFVDADGTRASLTCATNVTCVLTDSDTITATLIGFPTIINVGGTAGVDSTIQIEKLTGFFGTDTLAVDVVASGVNRIITGY